MTLPAEFIKQMEVVLGKQGTASLCVHLQERPTVAIRFNPIKTDSDLRTRILEKFGVTGIRQYETHSTMGYFLPERPEFYLDPLLHSGCYYVQEASSMYLESILPIMKAMRSQKPAEESFSVLDLCASPGGKSTHLLSMLSEIDNSFLVSNEVIKSRTSALCENISKWGATNSVVTNNDPADFSVLSSFFDVIVVDAPCSGEGMFRKDPVAVQEWSPENVNTCAARQRRILTDIIPSLRPEGLLVYSTCTFNPSEDEDIVHWITENYPELKLIEQKHFYPGDEKAGEGFFIATLRHSGKENIGQSTGDDALYANKKDNNRSFKKTHNRQAKLPFKEIPAFIEDGYSLSMLSDKIKAYPSDISEDMRYVESRMHVLQSGVIIASILDDRKKGTVTTIPEYSLIQSNAYKRRSLPEVDIDLHTAISYLKLDAIILPPDTPLGYVVLTYNNVPLGMVKNIGRRSNNLLPNSLRIRKQQ